MYIYDDIDQRIIDERVAQYRDQTRRYLAGELTDDEFRPLRLQNGLYIQRLAPMLRIAIPYGLLSSRQLRKMADIARRYDKGYGHFTTRTNLQFHWIKLRDAPDILDELAKVAQTRDRLKSELQRALDRSDQQQSLARLRQDLANSQRQYDRISSEIRRQSTSYRNLLDGGLSPDDWIQARKQILRRNEAMLVYILGLGSPTFPLDTTAWTEWTRTYQWGSYYGQAHLGFAPLFGHHYSQTWVDFRGIRDPYMRDRGIDYFENTRRATLAQREYAIANPDGWRDYGRNIWGLSASDGPADVTLPVNGVNRRFFTYAARGASFTEVRDDGTLAPTAAGGSLPFAPEVVIPALVAMRERYGDDLFGQYGFLDAFNPTFQFDTVPLTHGRLVPGVGWFDTDYLGIDQGPILAMIANYRDDLVWKYMRKSPYIVEGLRRAGFTGGWLAP